MTPRRWFARSASSSSFKNVVDDMQQNPSYAQLVEQVKTLSLESAKLKQAERVVQRHNEHLSALHETALALIAKLDKKELLESILERAACLTGTEHGYIYLLEAGEKEMQMRVGMGFFAGQLGRRVRLGEGMGGKVWEAEAPLLVDDYRIWPWRLQDKILDGLHNIVGIPLKSDRQVLGVIGLAHVDTEKHFDSDDITVLQRFAALALIALEKAALYADVKRELAERRKAEAKIRESEQRYRTVLEASPDPVVVYNMQGVATYVNPAFEQTFGLSRDELLGKQIDFVPEEAWPETKVAIEAMLSGQKINLFETKRLTRDGRKLDVQLSSTLYLNPEGVPVGNIVTLRDITARKLVEEELSKYRDHLEELVHARTAELAQSNLRLEKEIEDRRQAEAELKKREQELKSQSQHLEEVNTALRVLLKQREADKKELEENVLSNVKELVGPYLEKLKMGQPGNRHATLAKIIESNLNHITSPFIRHLASNFLKFTPTEIRIANLIKEGKTNEEMADLLLLSKNTILFHRHNIRKKLEITNKRVNLRSYLISLED
jgi:PAS domain S-box-containing protein